MSRVSIQGYFLADKTRPWDANLEVKDGCQCDGCQSIRQFDAWLTFWLTNAEECLVLTRRGSTTSIVR